MLGRLKFDIDELVNEMLDQLPVSVFESKSTTFFDPAMGGGQFLRGVIDRLRKYNHSDTNIASRVFGMESNQMRLVYAQKKNSVIGTLWKGGINELEDIDMKFDVVLGNPPYQDGSKTGGQNKIYNQMSVTSFIKIRKCYFLSVTMM